MSASRGFSLVEMLAAMAVFTIIGLILSQVTSSITRTTKQSTRMMDASTQARLVFDRIGMDLAGLVKRPDTDFVAQNFSTPGANPILLFLSSVGSSGLSTSNNRGLSIISYEVNGHTENKDLQGNPRPCLIRGGKAIPWSNSGNVPAAGFMGLQPTGLPQTFLGPSFPTALLPSTSQDFDMLGAGVMRMVVGFQLYPDNRPVQLRDGFTPAPNFSRGQIVYSPPVRTLTAANGSTEQYLDLNRVSAIIIGIVSLDAESLRLLDATQVTLLGNAFTTPDNSANKTPVQGWMATANAVNSLPATVPLQVRQAVRVYERTYAITPFTAQSP